jgi:RNA polymerase sigma factor (sigma-70 family)
MSRIDDLFNRYYQPLVKSLQRYGRSQEDARELAQEAFIETEKHLAGIAVGAEWAYLKIAAASRAANQHRDQQAKKRNADVPHPPDAPSVDAETRLIEQEQRDRIQQRFHEVLAELPEETQQIVILYLRGMSGKEIAAHLKLTPVAVRSRLSRVYAFFRERLADLAHELNWLKPDGEDNEKG